MTHAGSDRPLGGIVPKHCMLSEFRSGHWKCGLPQLNLGGWFLSIMILGNIRLALEFIKLTKESVEN